MKTTIKRIALLPLLIMVISCNKDGEELVLSGFEPAQLMCTQENIVLNEENANSIVLSLAWSNSEMSINNPNMRYSSSLIVNKLQIATENSFSIPTETSVDPLSIAYTGAELNALAKKMGLTIDVEAPLYFRLTSSIGANIATEYSNILKINVTPYEPSSTDDEDDPAYLYMPKADAYTDFSNRLYSRNDDRVYVGFVEAAQWDNFKFYTNIDGAAAEIYGSLPNELYKLDNSGEQWNIWFDEGGYFYIIADLNTLTWSKKSINSLVLTGDFNNWSETATPLVYDSEKKLWHVTCDINNIGWGMKLLINTDWDFCLTDVNMDGELSIAKEPNILPESTGIYTLTVYLSNPKKFTYKLEKQ